MASPGRGSSRPPRSPLSRRRSRPPRPRTARPTETRSRAPPVPSAGVVRLRGTPLLEGADEEVDAEDHRSDRPPLLDPIERHSEAGVEEQDEAGHDEGDPSEDRPADAGRLEVLRQLERGAPREG